MDGSFLAGDDFMEEQIALWFPQEREVFYEADAGNSEKDFLFPYMRYVNEVLGYAMINANMIPLKAMLVLVPGMGEEIEQLAGFYLDCQFNVT